jgi:hypothetical protein
MCVAISKNNLTNKIAMLLAGVTKTRDGTGTGTTKTKTRNGTIPGFRQEKPGTKKPCLKHGTEQNLA